MIATHLYAMQRDPKIWENPLEFDGFRFSAMREKETAKHQMVNTSLTSLTFGHGKHAWCDCIFSLYGYILSDGDILSVLGDFLRLLSWRGWLRCCWWNMNSSGPIRPFLYRDIFLRLFGLDSLTRQIGPLKSWFVKEWIVMSSKFLVFTCEYVCNCPCSWTANPCTVLRA